MAAPSSDIPSTGPILYLLDWNVANDLDSEDPFSSGRIAVGSPHSQRFNKTVIDHEYRPDGIGILQEGGGYIFWTQMGHPKRNDGIVQRSVDMSWV